MSTPAPLTVPPAERQLLESEDLPISAPPGTPWRGRISSATVIGVAVFVAMIGLELMLGMRMWNDMVPDQPVPGGVRVGTGTDAVEAAAWAAVKTAIPLTVFFLLVDRLRPMHLPIWLLTFGWGALGATHISAKINTWAASHLAIMGSGDPATATRAAVFVAPFVEEAAKACILFAVAIAMRHRWVSKLTGIALAGLSAVGFAFVENILYYARAFRAAAQVPGLKPEDAMGELVWLRGVVTCFGHPLFTSLTGIGLAIALRTRSKVVRILAPLAGYLGAALLHMCFNATASAGAQVDQRALALMVLLVAYPMVIRLIMEVIREYRAQKRLIRQRLEDYAFTGWLAPTVPQAMSRWRTRTRAGWQALWAGRAISTHRAVRTLTELAYLRDAITRGLVGPAGPIRERVLLDRLARLDRAIIEPWPHTRYPWDQAPEPRPWIDPQKMPVSQIEPAPDWNAPGRQEVVR